MKFIDQASLRIKAGDGGHGCIAFLREKFRPKGGPCGGDGGTMKMQNNGNGNGNGGGNGGGGISKKDLEMLIEKASQTGPTQTIKIEQAPIKISTVDDKPTDTFKM